MEAKKNTILLLAVLLVAFLVNLHSLSYFFFQDDWFILNDLKNHNFYSIFLPRNDIIYYRPIGIQSFFLISKNLFGVNPLGYHVLSYGAFVLSLILIYKVSQQLTGNRRIGLLASLLYGTAGIHYMALSWLSLTWNYIGLAFFLLALKFAIDYIDTQKNNHTVWAFIFFLLCLCSTEFALIFPFFVIGIFFSKNIKITKKILTQYTKVALPYIFVIIIYSLVRLFIIPLPAEGVYKPEVGPHIFKHYIWYFLWTINVPEMLKYHVNITSLRFTPEIISATKHILFPVVSLVAIEVVLLVYCVLQFPKKNSIKIMGMGLSLFMIALVPVISLRHHTYVYYLTIAALPVVFLIALVINNCLNSKNKINNIIAILTMVVWVALSLFGKSFNFVTHWVYAEQIVSKKIAQVAHLDKIKTPKTVFIYPTSKVVKLSLLDQQAMQYLYGPNVRTIYLESLSGHSVGKGDKFIMWDQK